jgi:hypothetical protein
MDERRVWKLLQAFGNICGTWRSLGFLGNFERFEKI